MLRVANRLQWLIGKRARRLSPKRNRTSNAGPRVDTLLAIAPMIVFELTQSAFDLSSRDLNFR
jgi:hypothetical protein